MARLPKSARTRRAYKQDVAHFMRTLDIATPDQLRQIDHRAVIAWERIMREEDGVAATDEADYRQREDETRRYVERQLSRGTPEGDLNAGGGMMGQLLDVHAHGAGDSPDFLPRWRALADKVEHQHAAMRAAGQSTDEFDRNMAASVRRFLAAKGLSEPEIDKRLASSADPLRAVEPIIAGDADSRRFENLA